VKQGIHWHSPWRLLSAARTPDSFERTCLESATP